ncbi:alpha/beta hydrolase [Streptomyces sp. CA-106131]|uniref:alpha/beta hydrolase n=1 Tax=Streptomyces sp. CA-106131 TaxID=3240045 RepID=UPI003D916EDA
MPTIDSELSRGVLDLQPSPPIHAPLKHGLHQFASPTRPALLYVPDRLPTRPRPPLLVAFHHAGGAPSDMLALLRCEAERRGVLLLAPAAARQTWDAVRNGVYGRDAAALRNILTTVRMHFPIDPDRIAIAGYRDGASYALGLGLANGNLFTRILAYSPDHIPPGCRTGRPTVFISHEQHNTPPTAATAGQRIVAALEDDGYHVDHIEHPGGQSTPASVVKTSAELLD